MTAQLPSKVRLAQIASFSKSMALPPSHDEIEAMARALLAAHEQEPVPNYIGSKNALEAIVAFIKSSSNPTLSDYNIVSERLFADNCQSLSSHVIEYITRIGGALEDLRQDAAHPAPVSAGQDNWKGQLTGTQCTPESVSKLSTGTSVGVAIVPAVPENPPFAVMQRALDAFYAEDDEVPENQMLAAYRVFRAAMLNGGKS
ncbi:hypothetical protein [Phytobacter sp. MRY16-398]|uniref:hypothetical protein n=1 Tax=Phytobacter sp. MRY16-398 TaxID=2487150 RepID=UPI000DF5DEE4|nr:hypothetical protein [Phytobacter sp. MRY16-398]BBE77418.1 hypothetical protein MRY16398_24740 [Phytobacter sp. MRY16-398]